MQQLNAELKQHMKTLRISEAAAILDNLLMDAEKEGFTYQQFLYKLISHEVAKREEKALERRFKQAAFPKHKTIEGFDIKEQKSISKKQLKQLAELQWLEQVYNLILLGPSGVGNYAKYLFM